MRDIDLAIGEGVDLLAPFYEGKEVRIDLYRLDAGVVIDGFQVVDALVVVIDVVEPMLLQELCVGALITLLEICFTLLEADLHRDGVEDIQELLVIALELRRAAAARQAAGQCEAGAEKRQHLLQFYVSQSMFSLSKDVCVTVQAGGRSLLALLRVRGRGCMRFTAALFRIVGRWRHWPPLQLRAEHSV